MTYDLDHQDIRDGVARLCQDFAGDYWQACDKDDAYPSAFVNRLTEEGYLSALIPEAYGGLGLSLSAGGAILEEIHRSGGNAAACHAQMYTMGTVLRHGSEAQKQSFLPGIACGDLRLQAFGVTEPGSGTDTSALKTTARKQGDQYIINGQKLWTSRAEHSDLMILLARTSDVPEGGKKTDGLSVFIVDMREVLGQSLTIRPVSTMMNHSTTQLFFDDMPVPCENLIGEEGKGFRYILTGMNAERMLIAAECIGDAKWFIQQARDYGCEREVFGRPIARNQGIQFPIARAYSAMRSAELMLNEASGCMRQARIRVRKLIWLNYSLQMPRGRQRKPVFRPLAVSALPQNIILSANIAKLGCIRLRPSQPILSLAILQNMC